MTFDLDLSEVQPLFATLSSVFSPGTSDQILLVAGLRVGAKAEELISPYPNASGKALPLYYTRERKDGTEYRSKFKSMAQQRKVMALAKQGKIPGKRTGDLGKSILAGDPTLLSPGLVVVPIGSKLAYAPYVIDRLMQSHYHLGTWTPIQDDIERGMPELRQVAVKSVLKEINRRIGNG